MLTFKKEEEDKRKKKLAKLFIRRESYNSKGLQDTLEEKRPFYSEENDILIMLAWFHARQWNYHKQKLKEEHNSPLPNQKELIDSNRSIFHRFEYGNVNLIVECQEKNSNHLSKIEKQVKKCQNYKLSLVSEGNI